MEGWIHEYAIRAAIDDFQPGTTRGSLPPAVPFPEWVVHMSLAARLWALRTACIWPAPLRTAHVQREIGQLQLGGGAWQLFQKSPRRARYQRCYCRCACADAVGSCLKKRWKRRQGRHNSCSDPDYDAGQWWRHVNEVISESVAHAYVRLFFWPGAGEAAGRWS